MRASGTAVVGRLPDRPTQQALRRSRGLAIPRVGRPLRDGIRSGLPSANGGTFLLALAASLSQWMSRAGNRPFRLRAVCSSPGTARLTTVLPGCGSCGVTPARTGIQVRATAEEVQLVQQGRASSLEENDDLMYEMREVFKLADTNRDSAIDARELQASMRVFGLALGREEVLNLMKDFDKDSSSCIEFDEFREMVLFLLNDDDMLNQLRLSRVVSRWSALLFDDDSDMANICAQRVGRVSQKLRQGMTESELELLLDDTSQQAVTRASLGPPRRRRLQQTLTKPAARTGGRIGIVDTLAKTWRRQRNSKLVRALRVAATSPPSRMVVFSAHWLLSRISVEILRRKRTAQVLANCLRWPALLVLLRPLLSGPFLMAIFRHPRSREALVTLLRSDNVEYAVARLLVIDAALAHVCGQPDSVERVGQVVGANGLGAFFTNFILAADPYLVRGFLRHRSTACLVAAVVRDNGDGPGDAATNAAVWVAPQHRALANAIGRICLEPGAELWAMHFCRTRGIDEWLGALLNDPRGASFCRDLLLVEGFQAKVDAFLGFPEAKAFVVRLLQQPGVCRFVTWLNRDVRLRQWFAQIACRENTMVFITEMLREPGLDAFIVTLLLRKGNDDALRQMLDYWIHTEGSFAEVFGSFSEKPRVDEALARVVMSPGFLDGFVLQRFLWQPGLLELAAEALALVGTRGLMKNVVPLTIAVLIACVALGFNGMVLPALDDLDYASVYDALVTAFTDSRMVQVGLALLGA